MVKFLQELCGLARHLQPATRNELLAQLVSLGLFEVHIMHRQELARPCIHTTSRACQHQLYFVAGSIA